MKFGKSEKIIISTVVVVIIASGAYFIAGQKSMELSLDKSVSKIKKSIASIEWKKKSVKYKKDKGVDFKSARSGQKIYNRESIFTQNNALANIEYKNATLLEMEPNTLVKLSQEKESIEIDLDKGFVTINNSKKTPAVSLKTGKRKFLIESTDSKIQVRYDGFGEPSLISLAGTAKISLQKKSVKLEKGRSLIVGEGTSIIKPNQEYIELTFPTHNSEASLGYSSPFYFEWNSNLKGADYQLEISKTITFKTYESLSRITRQRAEYYNLSKGSYYWRIRAEKLGVIFYSGIFKFDIIKVETPLITEKKLDIDLSKKKNRTIPLAWRGGSGWAYEIEISQKQGSGKKVFISDVNIFNWEPRTPGQEYSWRVRGTNPVSEWSDPGEIRLTYDGFLKNLMPNQAYLMPEDLFNGLDYRWGGSTQDIYHVQMAKDAEFKDMLYENKKVNSNTLFVEVDRSESRLRKIYWRVKSVDYPEMESETAEIFVRKPVGILSRPVNKKISLYNVNQKITFQWKVLKSINKENIKIQIANNEEFKNPDEILITPDTEKGIAYQFKETDKYYWRMLYTGERRDVMNSRTAYVDVIVPRPIDSPKIYKEYNLQYFTKNGKEIYPITWESVPETIGYVIEVYKDKLLSELVLRSKTEENQYIWEGRTSGQYFYRVQTLGTAGRVSNFSSLGKLIFPIAPLAN